MSSNQAGAAAREQIGPLTTIRFAAAIYVVFYHTLPRLHGDSWWAAGANNFLDLGYTAVGMFFVLSGFILATIYPRFADRKAISRFFLARFARIYPIYAIMLLPDVPRLFAWRIAKYGVVFGAAGTGTTLGAQLALLQTWVPWLGALNPPSWSVATECSFYLAFPFCLPFIARIRGVGRNVLLLAALVSVGIAIAFAAAIVFEPMPGWLTTVLERNPVLRGTDFLAGVVLANLRREIIARGPAATARAARTSIGTGLAGFCVIVAIQHGIAFTPLKSGLLIPFYASLILGLALIRGKAALLLSARPAVLLGEASYALYLIHAPAAAAFHSLGFSDRSPAYLLYLAFIIAVSVLLFLTIESWLRRRIVARGTAYLDARTAPAPALPVGVHLQSEASTPPSTARQWPFT